MIYYEFYGLPGAGKTTVTESVAQYLKEEGYKVAVIKEIYGTGMHKHLLEMLFSFSEYRLYYYYCRLYGKCHKRNKLFLKRLLYYSHQILSIIKKDKYDIMILDEGIIQFTSSLFFMEDVPTNNNLEKIANYFYRKIDIKPIFCSLDISVSMQRIKDRPYKQKFRYSYMRGAEVLKKALTYREKNLRTISSHFPSPIIINMEESAESNAHYIVSIIEKELKEKV